MTKLKNQSSERDGVKDQVQDIINVIKDNKIKEGVIDRTPRVIVKDVSYAGKKLRVSKSFLKNGKQSTLKAGAKWEEISPYFRKHLRFSQKDFK